MQAADRLAEALRALVNRRFTFFKGGMLGADKKITRDEIVAAHEALAAWEAEKRQTALQRLSDENARLGLHYVDEKAQAQPVAWRTRYRSEPGMIGNYPWAYVERDPERHGVRPAYEVEALYTSQPAAKDGA